MTTFELVSVGEQDASRFAHFAYERRERRARRLSVSAFCENNITQQQSRFVSLVFFIECPICTWHTIRQ